MKKSALIAAAGFAGALAFAAPAGAHEPGDCGDATTYEFWDEGLADGFIPERAAGQQIEGRRTIAIPAGVTTYYIDDRDLIGWWSYNGTVNEEVLGKKGDSHDHSGGLWVFEEDGRRPNLQRGGNNDNAPAPIKGALGGFDDPCNEGQRAFADTIIL